MADALRTAGLVVVEHDGWRERSHGAFTELRGVVWHHDASHAGDSPGVPAYMARQWDAGEASAHCWVDRTGRWHLIGAGVAWHAGKVLPGRLSNYTSLGVETDHTVGEEWPAQQLYGLRRGTAALLLHTTDHLLDFHRLICDPPGRKVDPDGLDIDHERAAVAVALQPRPTGDNDVQLPIVNSGSPHELVRSVQALINARRLASPPLKEDGLWGKVTTAAVNHARALHHMRPGPVDAPTWRILLGLVR